MKVTLDIEKIGVSNGVICAAYWKASAIEGEEIRSHSFSSIIDDSFTPEYFIELDDDSGKYYTMAYSWSITNLSDIHTNLVNELINFLYNR